MAEINSEKDKHNLKPYSEYHMMWIDFMIAHFYRLHFFIIFGITIMVRNSKKIPTGHKLN